MKIEIKKIINLLYEYFVQLINLWWFVVPSFILVVIDKVGGDTSKYLSYVSGASFVLANIIIFSRQKKRVQILEKKVKSYENKIPRLNLLFPNNKKIMTFTPTIYIKKPKVIIKTDSTAVSSIKNSFIPNSFQEMIAETFKSIKPYIENDQKYNRELAKWKRKIKSYSMIQIKIENNGNIPAENIDVYLNFPNYVELYEDLPEEPTRDSFYSRIHIPSSHFVTDFWSSVQKHKVNLHAKKIKHGHSETFESFYIKSKNSKEERIEVECEITADNLPQTQKTLLNFIIKPKTEEYEA